MKKKVQFCFQPLNSSTCLEIVFFFPLPVLAFWILFNDDVVWLTDCVQGIKRLFLNESLMGVMKYLVLLLLLLLSFYSIIINLTLQSIKTWSVMRKNGTQRTAVWIQRSLDVISRQGWGVLSWATDGMAWRLK